MGFSPFVFISLFYAVIGVRVIVRLVRSWRSVWDTRFTPQDRMLVDESAFFVLVPISVALHELGHAVAIWVMGGEVIDFGYYGFAGYVSYFPSGFSATQQTIIAAAGSFVNLALCLLALGAVFLSRPRMRSAVNELLLQFVFLSGINAFIVYPLLDLASGLNGDWRQMYDSGVPWLTTLIAIVQAGTLAAGYWLYTNPRMKARIASLVDVPPGFERGLLGGIRPGKIDPGSLSPTERVLREAADRVASGWSDPVRTDFQRFDGGTAIILQWSAGGRPRAVATRAMSNGRTDLLALSPIQGDNGSTPPRLMHQWPALPSEDDLTLGIRLAMETVDRGA
jgi:hypothetical protein